MQEQKIISTTLNQEKLIEWMEKNLPKNYTKEQYQEFYREYKRTSLADIPKKTDSLKVNKILENIMAIKKDPKALGLDNPTPIETSMAIELKANKIPFIHHFPLGRYELDFAIQYEGKKIDLECDGRAFHKKDYKQERRDSIRDSYVISQGYIPVRFSGWQITKNPAYCANIIRDMLTK